MVDEKTNRQNNIDNWMQLLPQLERVSAVAKVEKLEGYAKLTPDSTNPAMGYVTNLMPKSVADAQNPAFNAPNMGTIGDIVTGSVAVDAIESVRSHANVKSLKRAATVHPELRTSLPEIEGLEMKVLERPEIVVKRDSGQWTVDSGQQGSIS